MVLGVALAFTAVLNWFAVARGDHVVDLITRPTFPLLLIGLAWSLAALPGAAGAAAGTVLPQVVTALGLCLVTDLLFLTARWLQRRGARFVFDQHDLVPELYLSRFDRGKDLLYRAVCALERRTYRAADIVLATNESYRDVALARGGKRPEDVFVVRSAPDSGLRKLADETGGGYFELKKTADLAPTFTRVAQELHTQYVMGFTPTVLDGKVHQLSVKVKQRGMTARARRSYVAAASQRS